MRVGVLCEEQVREPPEVLLEEQNRQRIAHLLRLFEDLWAL